MSGEDPKPKLTLVTPFNAAQRDLALDTIDNIRADIASGKVVKVAVIVMTDNMRFETFYFGGWTRMQLNYAAGLDIFGD